MRIAKKQVVTTVAVREFQTNDIAISEDWFVLYHRVYIADLGRSMWVPTGTPDRFVRLTDEEMNERMDEGKILYQGC